MKASDEQITRLLDDLGTDDGEAAQELARLVQGELHALAERKLRGERAGHTLQPTALANEAWIRLVSEPNREYQNREHFFAVAARAIRNILVDHGRAHRAQRRGGGRPHANVAEIEIMDPAESDTQLDLLDLDAALEKLAALEPRQSRVVELRFFGGLSIEQCAAVLDVSPATVKRDWEVSRAWLFRELTRS